MGLPAARLHSRYNPQAEAERYIDALNLGGGIEYFILIEPGLGYLIPALQKRFNDSRIMVLHADSRFRENAAESPDVPVWYPDSGETVQGFLEGLIPDSGADKVRVIEWRPSLGLYGEACRFLAAETAEFIKRADASRRTAAAFGSRWVRNFFKNLSVVRRALRFRPGDAPVVITGSGPGLESALPRIRAMRAGALVLAAASSLPALAEGGVVPDMAISTDGGAWALLHLYACFRGPGTPRLAAALTAALPSQCAALPLLALSDGSLWQNMVLAALGIPSALIPQRGTVTASALELALVISSGPVYLAGMDLAVRDIRTHARPYGFDHLWYSAASRLRPLYSRCFARSNDTRRGGSHAVYASWFKSRLAAAAWPDRIFPLGDNHAVFGAPADAALPRQHEADGKEPWFQETCFQETCFQETAISGSPAERAGRGAGVLIDALGDPRYAPAITGELGPLLFPEANTITADDIREALRGIAARYGGNRG
jgi:hypothetical protein